MSLKANIFLSIKKLLKYLESRYCGDRAWQMVCFYSWDKSSGQCWTPVFPPKAWVGYYQVSPPPACWGSPTLSPKHSKNPNISSLLFSCLVSSVCLVSSHISTGHAQLTTSKGKCWAFFFAPGSWLSSSELARLHSQLGEDAELDLASISYTGNP